MPPSLGCSLRQGRFPSWHLKGEFRRCSAVVLHGQGSAQHRGKEAWLQNGSLWERACQGWNDPTEGLSFVLQHKCWGLPAGLGPNSAGLKCSELCCRSQGQCCHCCVWDMFVCGLVDLPGSVRVLSDASSIKSLCVQAQMSVYLPPGCNSNSLASLSRFSTWGLTPRRMQFLRLVVVTAGLQ